MEFVTCNNCGKKILDISDKCAFCNSMRKTKKKTNASRNDDNSDICKFADIEEQLQIELEKEFLNAEPWAKKYVCSITEQSGYAVAGILCAFVTVAVILYVIYINNLAVLDSGLVYSPWVELFIVSCLLTVLFFVISLIISFVLQIRINLKEKRKNNLNVYHQEFKRWLLEEKEIDYTIPGEC